MYKGQMLAKYKIHLQHRFNFKGHIRKKERNKIWNKAGSTCLWGTEL